MPKDKRDVESALKRKGFIVDNNKHHKFYYRTQEGLKTAIFTQTSHSRRSKTIADNLLCQMARQCKMTIKQFTLFIDCDLDQNQYEEILAKHGLLK